MSKLDELIQKLCPNGVEHKHLKEVVSMQRGTSITKKDMKEGTIPVISGGRIPAYFCDKSNRDEDIISVAGSGAGAGFVQYWNSPIFACDCFTVKGKECLLTKFVYYYLSNIQEKIYSTKKGSGVPHVHISDIENFIIPVPPMEVQCEIVRILDNFKELTAELTKELTAELTARRKQYEYYRKELFIFDIKHSSAQLFKIKDICTRICSGGTPNTSNRKYYDGNIPWLRTQEVNFGPITDTDVKITEEGLNASSAKWVNKNAVIVAMYGATVGKVAYTNIALTTNQACCNLEIDNKKAVYKYVYYYLTSKYEYIKSLGQGSQTNINADIVKNLDIFLPNLDEQQRIVDILDKFDAYCNDLTQGLPAEIELRQKQYEYYREKLLTFKNINEE